MKRAKSISGCMYFRSTANIPGFLSVMFLSTSWWIWYADMLLMATEIREFYSRASQLLSLLRLKTCLGLNVIISASLRRMMAL